MGIGKAQKDWYHDRLKNPGDWGVSYTWEWVEKDAVVSLFSYSDLDYQQTTSTSQNGSTNVEASIIRFDYELFPNFQLTAKSHFINVLDRSIATTNNGKPSDRQSDADALAARCGAEVLRARHRKEMTMTRKNVDEPS